MLRTARALVVGVLMVVGTSVAGSLSATASTPEPLVPYGAGGYRYQQVPTGGGPTTFSDVDFDDSAFSVGSAPFGQEDSEFDCPLAPVTPWAPNTDLLVRRTVDVPAGATDVVIRFAIDNDIEVYWNGTLVDVAQHSGCASQGSVEVSIPDDLLTSDDNVLAVRATDHGGETFLDLEVTANLAPDCASLTTDQTTLWPPNHDLRTITAEGGADPEGEPLTLAITSVTQDELLDGPGDGNSAPDADRSDLDANQVRLRAERAGDGDGRVYRLEIVATDVAGASCSSVITVGVPHDQRGGGAVDTASVVVDSFGTTLVTASSESEHAPSSVADDHHQSIEVNAPAAHSDTHGAGGPVADLLPAAPAPAPTAATPEPLPPPPVPVPPPTTAPPTESVPPPTDEKQQGVSASVRQTPPAAAEHAHRR